MWILANLKIIAIGAAILAIFSSGWWVESQLAENRLEKALSEQETALHAQCDADKKLTSEVSNGLQKKLSATNARLNELKRVYAATACVPIARAASGDNAANGAKPVGQDGVTTQALLDYGNDAEKIRLQLDSCQEFIRKVWAR